MSTYSKPDVEVYQQFRLPQGDIRPAVLQSCLVGPLYQIFKDEVVGTYDNTEKTYYFPYSLKPGAVVKSDTMAVRVIQYGEVRTVAASNLVTAGVEGDISVGFLNEFQDYSKDFLNMSIITHTDADSNDGDYLHIPVGPNASGVTQGYFKILEVVDSHTLRLAEELLPAEGENYEIRSVGYMIENETIGVSLKLTPNLGFSGDVTVGFKALRTDRDRPFEWTRDDLIAEVGDESQIVPENPLAYGASLALSVLGSLHFVSAMPVLSDDLAGYTAAVDALESEEVYGITCLTHNIQVAQMLMAHVTAMSDPMEKKERIGIINTGFTDTIVKVGYIDVTDGSTSFSGINSTETVITEAGLFNYAPASDGDYVKSYTELAPTRASVHFPSASLNIAAGAVVRYALASAPLLWINIATDTDMYHVIINAPAGDSISKIGYSCAGYDAAANPVAVFALATAGEAEYTECSHITAASQIANIEPVTELISVTATHITEKRMLLNDKPLNPATVKLSIPNMQNFVQGGDFAVIENAGFWYIDWAGRNLESVIAQGMLIKASYVKGDCVTDLITPTAGHKALKIRAYDVTPSVNLEKPESYVFPEGMLVTVVTESDVLSFNRPGTYVFDRDILAIYKTVSTVAVPDKTAIDTLIELMIVPAVGSYSRNKFVDANAHFITAATRVNPSDKLVIKSGASAGEYEILAVISDSELIVNTQFGVFETGLEYQINQGSVSKLDLAKWFSQISASFAERRITNIYCPFVGSSSDGVSVDILPGYFYNCVIAGAIQVLAPQAGLTNMVIPGFSQVFYVSDYFTEKQLDEIASGGTFIIMQNNKWTVPYCRHQLTTDMSMLEKRELSCVKDLDYIAKMGRETLRPYIGRFLVNEVTMTTLYSVANAFLQRCKDDGLANANSNLMKIYVDPNARDTVVICLEIELPVPLNKIKLYIYV